MNYKDQQELYHRVFGDDTFSKAVLQELNHSNTKTFFSVLVSELIPELFLEYDMKEIRYYILDHKSIALICDRDWLKKGKNEEIIAQKCTLHAILPNEAGVFRLEIPEKYLSDFNSVLNGDYSKVEKLVEKYNKRSLSWLVCKKDPSVRTVFEKLEDYLQATILEKGEVFHPFKETDYLYKAYKELT